MTRVVQFVILVLLYSQCMLLHAQPALLWLRDGQPLNVQIVAYNQATHLLITHSRTFLYVWDTDADTVIWRTYLPSPVEWVSYVDDSTVMVLRYRDLYQMRIRDGSIVQQTSCSCVTWASPTYRFGGSMFQYKDLDSIIVTDIKSGFTVMKTQWREGHTPFFKFWDYDTTTKRLYCSALNTLFYIDSSGVTHSLDTLERMGDLPVGWTMIDNGTIVVTVVQQRDSLRAVLYAYDRKDLQLQDSLYIASAPLWPGRPFLPIGKIGESIVFDAFLQKIVVVRTSPLRIEQTTVVDVHGPAAVFVQPDSVCFRDLSGANIIHDVFSSGNRMLLPKRTAIRNAHCGPNSELLVEQEREAPIVLNIRTGEDELTPWNPLPRRIQNGDDLHVGGRSGCAIVSISNIQSSFVLPYGDTTVLCKIEGEDDHFGLGVSRAYNPYVCWADSTGTELDIVFRHSLWVQGFSEYGIGIYRTSRPCTDTMYTNQDYSTTFVETEYEGNQMPLPVASEDGGSVFVPGYKIVEGPFRQPLPGITLITGIQHSSPYLSTNRAFSSYRGLFLHQPHLAVRDTDSGYLIFSTTDSLYQDRHVYGSRYLPMAILNSSDDVIMHGDSGLQCLDPNTGTIKWKIIVPAVPTRVLIEPRDRWMCVIYAFGRIELYALDPSVNVPHQESESAPFRVYPNPVHDQLTVTCSTTVYDYQVRDIVGRLVYGGVTSTPSSQFTIDTGLLVSGTYMLVLHTDRAYSMQAFIKH
ncbi:hypothetical protein BH10BAC6_BH10BAC6_13440 [soil metagenome]